MAGKRAELWQEHITQWRSSGLSGMAYCKQESLAYGRFVYWRKLCPVLDYAQLFGRFICNALTMNRNLCPEEWVHKT
ncbi:hypothetical protein ECTOBSL9_0257 [Ectothiorhodospira sp. BSL-9]|nr:hypothetical protein ECTOBSL9_0257 [Ectothiorhodospira sp. BSL-9]